MSRRTAVVVLALALNPALLHAQESTLTVTVASADVYKGPTTATPVIGHVTQGTVLPVERNLGSWVRVAWPDAPDGGAYVHVTMGRLGAGDGSSSAPTTRRASETAPAAAPSRASQAPRVAPRGTTPTPESHILGIGGLLAPTSSFGATARAWRNNRVGIQLGVARDAMTSDLAAGRVTSMQIEPGVVYALFDRVTDYLWVRPYVGSSVLFRRDTLSAASPIVSASTSDNGVGFRVFGGGELTFASVPRFGVSADVGYRHLPTPFPGFEPAAVSVSIAGHWYVK